MRKNRRVVGDFRWREISELALNSHAVGRDVEDPHAAVSKGINDLPVKGRKTGFTPCGKLSVGNHI